MKNVLVTARALPSYLDLSDFYLRLLGSCVWFLWCGLVFAS